MSEVQTPAIDTIKCIEASDTPERLDATLPVNGFRPVSTQTPHVSDRSRQAGVKFEEVRKSVFNHLFRMSGNRDVAEDLTQETAVRCVRFFNNWDSSRPFVNWALRISTNAYIDYTRMCDRRIKPVSYDNPEALRADFGDSAMAAVEVIRDPHANVFEAVAELEMFGGFPRKVLDDAISHLSPPFRDVMDLLVKGIDLTTIAEMLEIPYTTARTRSHRAKKLLGGILGSYPQEAV